MNSELTHFGIPGMKWGHRKSSEDNPYGMSKRQAKKTFNKSPQKAYKDVSKRYHDELKRAMDDAGMDEKYKKLGLDKQGLDPKEAERRFNIWNKEASDIKREIAKKFVGEFNDSLLKDINYKDVEKGKKMLKAYNMNFKPHGYGIITTDHNKLKNRAVITVY